MPRIFERLAGLETEYAIRFRPARAGAGHGLRFRCYEAVIGALRQRLPVVRARHFKEGVFLANGGAVWFEAERPSAGGGLIEGSTPECRGPREVVAYQRAQDHLMMEAARATPLDGELALLKNDRDARDQVYGAQENYETTLATGGWLFAWRMGLVFLFPLACATWLGIGICLLTVLGYFALAGLVYLVCCRWTHHRERWAARLFGPDLAAGREKCVHVPLFLEASLQIATRIVTAPLAVALDALLRGTAFRRVRRQLLPFLVTRPIVHGSGLVDRQGNFQLSDKGPSVNCVQGFGGLWGDRPVFTMGHFFKAIYAQSWFSPREYGRLFAARQRLQIGLGDSNMCQTAEYLRVGTTLLLLDAIESGGLRDVPRIRRPIRALHRVCRDTSLCETLELSTGRRATALQIQRFFYEACCDFVARRTDVPEEARDVLELWRKSLDGLEQLADDGLAGSALVGRLDWVTKGYLLSRAGAGATWSERKKIDLRYHELSPAGYFQQLEQAGAAPRIVRREELDRALRLPPPNSPATMRGHYIREFARGDEPISASWTSVTIGQGRHARVVPLHRARTRSRNGPA